MEKDNVVKHDKMLGALDYCKDAFGDVVRSGKFMVAMWKMEKGEPVLATRTTWDFPKEKFGKSIELLQESLVSEKGKTEPPGELPFADFLTVGKDGKVVEETRLESLGLVSVPMVKPTEVVDAPTSALRKYAEALDKSIVEGDGVIPEPQDSIGPTEVIDVSNPIVEERYGEQLAKLQRAEHIDVGDERVVTNHGEIMAGRVNRELKEGDK